MPEHRGNTPRSIPSSRAHRDRLVLSRASDPYLAGGRATSQWPEDLHVVMVICEWRLTSALSRPDETPHFSGRDGREVVAGQQTDMNFEMMLSHTDRASLFQCLLTRPGPIRQIVVTKLDEYKTRLLEELKAEPQTFLDHVKSAVTEAEALAWSTPYPHLFLPALAEEKIACVQQWTRRQYLIATSSLDAQLPGLEALTGKVPGERAAARAQPKI